MLFFFFLLPLILPNLSKRTIKPLSIQTHQVIYCYHFGGVGETAFWNPSILPLQVGLVVLFASCSVQPCLYHFLRISLRFSSVSSPVSCIFVFFVMGLLHPFVRVYCLVASWNEASRRQFLTTFLFVSNLMITWV